MKSPEFNNFTVFTSWKCQLSCEHCVTRSGPKNTTSLLEDDLGAISKFLRDFKVKTLTFSGGEPLLNKKIMLDVINIKNKYQLKTKVRVATNGLFARSEKNARSLLEDLDCIDKFIVSFDEFHGQKALIEEGIKNLKKISNELGIELKCFIVKKSPFFLSYVHFCEQNDIDYEVYLLNGLGRAYDLDLSKDYMFRPTLKNDALLEKCDLLDNLNYYPEMGFTNCCSNLIFKDKPNPKFYSRSLSTYLNSEFFKTIQSMNFSEMAKIAGIKDINGFESKCDICEVYFGKTGCNRSLNE